MRTPGLFTPDRARYEGVRPVNIYLLRGLFVLMAAFVSYDSWSYILKHSGPWDPMAAVAWCMFASYSLLSIVGVFRPLTMLPVVLLVILYKSIWLIVVAYPLWSAGTLAGSPAEPMAKVFIWVPLAIVATPWRYVIRTYILGRGAGHHAPSGPS